LTEGKEEETKEFAKMETKSKKNRVRLKKDPRW
jgi:hypothetical protein